MSIRSRRVARGVALLDTMKPGWHRKITRPLDLCDDVNCVLGQVYGSFPEGLKRLGGQVTCFTSRFGFMTHCGAYYILTYPLCLIFGSNRTGEFLFRRSERKYAALWQEVIDARKKEAAGKIVRATTARSLANDMELFLQSIHKDALYTKVDA